MTNIPPQLKKTFSMILRLAGSTGMAKEMRTGMAARIPIFLPLPATASSALKVDNV